MIKVLIIEDNWHVAEAIKDVLKSTYTVEIAHSGSYALGCVQNSSFDIILLDLGLPDMNGKEVYRQLRHLRIDIPVLVISGDDTIKNKVSALDMGADDYITKPFHRDELKARMRSALRRYSGRVTGKRLIINGLEIDPIGHTVTYQGESIDLRPKEFDVLEYMMRNAGRTLSRQLIVDHVWERSDVVWTNSVDVHIKHLRDKIDRRLGTHFITTVHGIGYKFALPPAEASVISVNTSKGGVKNE